MIISFKFSLLYLKWKRIRISVLPTSVRGLTICSNNTLASKSPGDRSAIINVGVLRRDSEVGCIGDGNKKI